MRVLDVPRALLRGLAAAAVGLLAAAAPAKADVTYTFTQIGPTLVYSRDGDPLWELSDFYRFSASLTLTDETVARGIDARFQWSPYYNPECPNFPTGTGCVPDLKQFGISSLSMWHYTPERVGGVTHGWIYFDLHSKPHQAPTGKISRWYPNDSESLVWVLDGPSSYVRFSSDSPTCTGIGAYCEGTGVVHRVPEPAGLALLATGLGGLGLVGLRLWRLAATT